MRNTTTREGFEFWDRLCKVPRHIFLLAPSGTRVQKFEDRSGNWIDVYDAQQVVDAAQDKINELTEQLQAAQVAYFQLNQHTNVTEGFLDEAAALLVSIAQSGNVYRECTDTGSQTGQRIAELARYVAQFEGEPHSTWRCEPCGLEQPSDGPCEVCRQGQQAVE